MKIVNGNKLWERLKSAPFFNVPISSLSKVEIEILLRTAIDYVVEEDGGDYGHKVPAYHGNGHLVIPWNAPAKYRYWQRDLSCKEKYELFIEMGVPPEDMHFFMYLAGIEEATQ